MEKRIHWIDVLKGIGIILVVLQHCIGLSGDTGVSSFVSVWILSFHMPLFFYVSGLVYKEKSDNAFFAGKLRTLLLPVILFSLLNVIIKCTCRMLHIDVLYDFLNFAGFWFVLTILYIQILYFVLEKANFQKANEWAKVIIALIALLVGLYYSSIIQGKENTIATTLVGSFFFAGGVLNQKYTLRSHKIARIVLSIVCLSTGAILAQKNTPIMMYSSNYGNQGIFVLAAICGCLGLKHAAEIISECRVLEWFGKNSLMILFTHFPVHRCVMKILSYTRIDMVSKSILGCVFVLMIEIPIVILINKYAPILKGVIKEENNTTNNTL